VLVSARERELRVVSALNRDPGLVVDPLLVRLWVRLDGELTFKAQRVVRWPRDRSDRRDPEQQVEVRDLEARAVEGLAGNVGDVQAHDRMARGSEAALHEPNREACVRKHDVLSGSKPTRDALEGVILGELPTVAPILRHSVAEEPRLRWPIWLKAQLSWNDALV
jgi:hypothetical protein